MTHRAFFLQRMGRNPEALAQHLASIDLLEPLDEPYFLTFAFIMYGTSSWSSWGHSECYDLPATGTFSSGQAWTFLASCRWVVLSWRNPARSGQIC